MERRVQIVMMVMWMVVVTCLCVIGKARAGERIRVYLHDTSLYRNASFNTATVDAPASESMSTVANQFGKMYIFDDPLTSGHSISSPHVGSAQGLYVYSSRGNVSAFWAFTAFLGSRGSLSFMGAEFLGFASRSLPVVGGTGEFALARGIATISTAAIKLPGYFVLSIDIDLH